MIRNNEWNYTQKWESPEKRENLKVKLQKFEF